MDVLLVLNDGLSAGGRSESALQLAVALLRAEDATVRVFLLNDAVRWAAAGDPDAHGQGLANAIPTVVSAGGMVAVSDLGMNAHGMTQRDLVMGAESTAISTLAAWCLTADRLMVF